MDKYDIERAVAAGVRRGTSDDSEPLTSQWGIMFLAVLGFLPVLLGGLFHSSWSVFAVGMIIVIGGMIYYRYVLAIFTPIAYEYILFMFTLKDLREEGIEFNMLSLLWEFAQETAVIFFVCLIIALWIAKRSW